MHSRVDPHPTFPSIYRIMQKETKRLATRNLTPGRNVYGEKLITYKGVEYRLWDPFRSKLAAAIMKNLENFPIKPTHKVLYLGAASGTTASHVSDIVGSEGHVYCIEFAHRTIRELINNVCTFRANMSPVLEDARFPQKYAMFISERVNEVYCDIAQPEQARILADNARLFLGKQGRIMLAVKAHSIDVTKEPSQIYRREVKILQSRGYSIKEIVNLEPYDKAHAMVVATQKE